MIEFMLAGVLIASAQDGWTYREVTDPITDARRGIASVNGDNGSMLVVKCDSDGSGMYMHLIASEYLGGDGRGFERRALIFRVDQNAPVTQQWHHRDNDAIVRNQRDLFNAVKEMIEGERVHVRATRYDSRRVDMSFSLDGAKDAMRQAFEACQRN
ncbi:hypothetical protein [Brevundimonas sp.]|uniref:hypothetical protein n=1 Tax=Brevundimonas sp. TaxID=1871086 RepID=UPI0028A1FB78|nr:hypothetical protein [Brevundimonas sp.]